MSPSFRSAADFFSTSLMRAWKSGRLRLEAMEYLATHLRLGEKEAMARHPRLGKIGGLRYLRVSWRQRERSTGKMSLAWSEIWINLRIKDRTQEGRLWWSRG